MARRIGRGKRSEGRPRRASRRRYGSDWHDPWGRKLPPAGTLSAAGTRRVLRVGEPRGGEIVLAALIWVAVLFVCYVLLRADWGPRDGPGYIIAFLALPPAVISWLMAHGTRVVVDQAREELALERYVAGVPGKRWSAPLDAVEAVVCKAVIHVSYEGQHAIGGKLGLLLNAIDKTAVHRPAALVRVLVRGGGDEPEGHDLLLTHDPDAAIRVCERIARAAGCDYREEGFDELVV